MACNNAFSKWRNAAFFYLFSGRGEAEREKEVLVFPLQISTPTLQ